MSLTMQSPAFVSGQRLPQRHTGDGEDVSPALKWENVPPQTRELALICDDPDAPTPRPWVHWILYKIPTETRSLPERLPTTEKLTEPAGALQGKNSWGAIGYRGPAPPPGHGIHHYHFRLYALDQALTAKPGLEKAALLQLMNPHIIAQGELVGIYQR